MVRSVLAGLVAELALAAIVFGAVQLTGDPAPARTSSPPLAAHRAEGFAADDVADELWNGDRDAAANGMRPGGFDHFTVTAAP